MTPPVIRRALARVAVVTSATALTAASLTGPAAADVAASASAATVLVVDSTGDAADRAPDGVCATTAGECTLRAALQEANRAPGGGRVEFAIPGAGPHEIRTTGRLPELSNPAGVTVDGYTQPGSAVNTALHGSNARIMVQVRGTGTTGGNGFYVTGPGNVLRGLAIYDYKVAVWLVGAGATGNSVVGSFVCTDATGTFGATRVDGGAGGILLATGPSRNGIGVPASYDGTTPVSLADRNVISGCAHRGVILSNRTTNANQVRNNVVGLRPDGSAALPNRSHGIDVNYNGQDNVIGGLRPNEHNVVSGNTQEGIEVSHGPFNRRNKVLGNLVGTDVTGTRVLPFTGNGMMGIRLEGEKTCAPCSPNAGYAEVAWNVVVGNAAGLLVDKGQQRNDVHDNWVGVLRDGTPAGNRDYGLRVEQGAVDNVFARNTIAHNGRGVQVLATASQPPSSYVLPVLRNTFTQNRIHDNGGLGIDLGPLNNANVGGTGDPAVQEGVRAPVVRSVASDGSSVTVDTCASCTVELFDTGRAPATWTGLAAFGQGRTYLATAVADATGTAVVRPAVPLADRTVVAATATTPAGSTGEFSRAVTVTRVDRPVAVRAVSSTGNAVTVAWDQPSDTGGLPVTGYRVEVAPSASGAPLRSAQLPADAQGWTATGLASDTAWTVTVRALTQAGVAASGSVEARTKVLTRTSVEYGGPASVPAGTAIVLTGRVVDSVRGSGIGGVAVVVTVHDAAGAKLAKVRSVVTAQDGTWTATVVATRSGRYRAAFQGTADAAASLSPLTGLVTVA